MLCPIVVDAVRAVAVVVVVVVILVVVTVCVASTCSAVAVVCLLPWSSFCCCGRCFVGMVFVLFRVVDVLFRSLTFCFDCFRCACLFIVFCAIKVYKPSWLPETSLYGY